MDAGEAFLRSALVVFYGVYYDTQTVGKLSSPSSPGQIPFVTHDAEGIFAEAVLWRRAQPMPRSYNFC